MKKLIAVVLLASFLVAGCGSEPAVKEEATPVIESTPVPTPTIDPIAQALADNEKLMAEMQPKVDEITELLLKEIPGEYQSGDWFFSYVSVYDRDQFNIDLQFDVGNKSEAEVKEFCGTVESWVGPIKNNYDIVSRSYTFVNNGAPLYMVSSEDGITFTVFGGGKVLNDWVIEDVGNSVNPGMVPYTLKQLSIFVPSTAIKKLGTRGDYFYFDNDFIYISETGKKGVVIEEIFESSEAEAGFFLSWGETFDELRIQKDNINGYPAFKTEGILKTNPDYLMFGYIFAKGDTAYGVTLAARRDTYDSRMAIFNESIKTVTIGADNASDPVAGYVNADTLNLREEPSREGEVLGKYARGQSLEILGKEEDWYKVSIGGAVGYMARGYVSLSKDELNRTTGKATPSSEKSIEKTTQEPSEAKPEPTPEPTPKETVEPTYTEKVGGTIYVTPTGKRYHYDGNCNGGTYIASTLDEALSRGLTPCKKCAK